MKIIVDLSSLRTEEETLQKFGEVFEFGGPEGNIPVSILTEGKGWGLNWNAMNDSLRYLEEGGIWGTSKKFSFPLEIELLNYKEFRDTDPGGFQILKEILDRQTEEYKQEEKVMKVVFS